MSRSLKTRPFSAEIQLNGMAGAAIPSEVKSAAFSGQAEILEAIAELRQELFRNGAVALPDDAPQGQPAAALTDEMRQARDRDLGDARILKSEIEKLSSAIETTKHEIASMRFKDSHKQERITDVTHELDEVVLDTERATNGILSACEEIEKHADAIRLHTSSEGERNEIEALGEKVLQIYEACNFQDITGQRITKVVNTLKFIEQRLDVMMGIWGGHEAFAEIKLPDHQVENPDDLLLNGPARAGDESVNQADIDALFD